MTRVRPFVRGPRCPQSEMSLITSAGSSAHASRKIAHVAAAAEGGGAVPVQIFRPALLRRAERQPLLGDVPDRLPPAARQGPPGHAARRLRYRFQVVTHYFKGQNSTHFCTISGGRSSKDMGSHGVFF